MDEGLQRETSQLEHAWMRHDDSMLREYLVSEVEDPRINVQSILTRHFLLVALFGQRFERLHEEELRFASVMNWAREVFPHLGGDEDLLAIRHALGRGADNAEGTPIPSFVTGAFRLLPLHVNGVAIPNYVEQLLEPGAPSPADSVLGTFQRAWAHALGTESPRSNLKVLEPACGSANDYRFLDSYGIGRLIEYTGFDLCEKNVSNARALFPGVHFEVANVFEIPDSDRAFDYSVVHDLFEHLSLAGLERALTEVCRVTRTGLSLGFFNAWEDPEHVVRPAEPYHWNTLSLPRIGSFLHGQGFSVQIIHIDTLLRWRSGCDQTHNKNAYTLLAERVTRD